MSRKNQRKKGKNAINYRYFNDFGGFCCSEAPFASVFPVTINHPAKNWFCFERPKNILD
ncbi:MAG: hypothetical protein GXO78_04035 [Calditrichaeota bacterium]|nr:hypothetical protein [Calditrichota bacterium]